MNKTKIEWCDSTWNPVTGCYHNCEYCYARKIATRFGGNDKLSTFRYGQKDWHRSDNNKGCGIFYDQASKEKPMLFVVDKPLLLPCKLDKRKTEKYRRQIFENKKAPYPFDFNPTFHCYRLDEPIHKAKPQTIFVCSMADLFGSWVPDEWIEEVFAACEKAPQHRYLFLTKNPQRYIDLAMAGKLPAKDNMWYGTTATTPDEPFFFGGAWHTFVSIEPILRDYRGEIGHMCNTFAQWVIVGAETGNRKGKVIPKRKWIDAITKTCIECHIALFMKDSLIPIVGEDNMFRIFPWDDNFKDCIEKEQKWLDKKYIEENQIG